MARREWQVIKFDEEVPVSRDEIIPEKLAEVKAVLAAIGLPDIEEDSIQMRVRGTLNTGCDVCLVPYPGHPAEAPTWEVASVLASCGGKTAEIGQYISDAGADELVKEVGETGAFDEPEPPEGDWRERHERALDERYDD